MKIFEEYREAKKVVRQPRGNQVRLSVALVQASSAPVKLYPLKD
jgi:hypothetical protein